MEKWFGKYKRFLGTVFLLWLFLWMAGKFGFDFAVNLAIFFRVFLGMFLVLMFWEIRIRKVEIIAFIINTQEQVSLALDEYPTVWSKVIHFLPLMFSFSWKLFKKCASSKRTVLGLFVLGILVDIFALSFSSDLITLALIGLWIRSIQLYKLEGRISLTGGLVFLILGQFLFMLGSGNMAEKSATWTYLFLIIGVVQGILEKKDES